MKNPVTVGPLKDAQGATVSDTVGMANLLNGTFKSVFTRDSRDDGPDLPDMAVHRQLATVKFSVKKVKDNISDLQRPHRN
jgi:hypothetical protein